jgi:hypothetical protein
MPADPNTLDYRRTPGRSFRTWLILWLVWGVGLIVWAAYVVGIIVAAVRVFS